MVREKEIIHVPRVDAFAHLGFMRPQNDLVRALAAQHNRDRRTPGACSNHCDLAHKKPFSKKTIFGACQQTPDIVFVTNNDEQGREGDGKHDRGGSRTRI